MSWGKGIYLYVGCWVVGLKSWDFIGWKLKLASLHGERGRPPHRYEGGRFNRQGNLHSRLVLGSHNMSSSLLGLPESQ